MTDPDNPQGHKLPPYVAWLLDRRDEQAVRVALRRGGVAELDAGAVRYLAPFWGSETWKRTPTLLHASLATTYPLAHEDGVPLGRMLAGLAAEKRAEGGEAEDRMAGRLATVQRLALPVAHKVLASFFPMAVSSGLTLDWRDLYWAYLKWDHPDSTKRYATRRKLLEDFVWRPTSPTPPDHPSTNHAAPAAS